MEEKNIYMGTTFAYLSHQDKNSTNILITVTVKQEIKYMAI